jgi:hypothetical protein
MIRKILMDVIHYKFFGISGIANGGQTHQGESQKNQCSGFG